MRETCSAGRLLWSLIILAAPSLHAENGDVVINEVSYLGGEEWVELRNTGSDTIDVTSWWLCARFGYTQISAMSLLDGADRVLGPGEIITLGIGAGPGTLISLNDSSSDLGLYTTNSFGSQAAMVDFVQWGTSQDVGRSDVATGKGVWLEVSLGVYDFVATASSGHAAAYCDRNTGGGFLTLSSDFENHPPTRGAANPVCAPPNQPPIANSQSVVAMEDEALDIVLTGSDGNGDELTFEIESAPDHGDLSAVTPLSGTTARVTYMPDSMFNGDDSFTFTVNDGSVSSPVATLDVEVEPLNDRPNANPQTVSTEVGQALLITLTGSDPDGDAVDFEIVSGPDHGQLGALTVVGESSAEVTYTPTGAFAGSDGFEFRVLDAEVASDPARVRVEVGLLFEDGFESGDTSAWEALRAVLGR